MSNLIISFLLTIVLAISLSAQTRTNSGDSSSAQIDTTSTQIKTWLMEMVSKPIPGQYKVADYKEMLPLFNQQLSEALAAFEATLKEQILPVVMTEVDIYNRIYKSTQFDLNEKNRALSLSRERLQSTSNKASTSYQQAISKLLTAVNSPKLLSLSLFRGPYGGLYCSVFVFSPATNSFELRNRLNSGGSRQDCTWNRFLTIDFTIESKSQQDLKDAVYQSIVTFAGKSCRSELCVSLRAYDMIKVLGFILNQLNKSITIKLADNNEIRIENINFVMQALTIVEQKLSSEVRIINDYTPSIPFTQDNKMFFDSADFPHNFPEDTE